MSSFAEIIGKIILTPFYLIGYILWGTFWFVYQILKGVVYFLLILFITLGFILSFWVALLIGRELAYKQGYVNAVKGLSKTFYVKDARKVQKLYQTPIQTSQTPLTNPTLPAQPTYPPGSAAELDYNSLHCPGCGEIFTAQMGALMRENKEVFCEFCGMQIR
jgi:hypothetical protein